MDQSAQPHLKPSGATVNAANWCLKVIDNFRTLNLERRTVKTEPVARAKKYNKYPTSRFTFYTAEVLGLELRAGKQQFAVVGEAALGQGLPF